MIVEGQNFFFQFLIILRLRRISCSRVVLLSFEIARIIPSSFEVVHFLVGDLVKGEGGREEFL